MRAWVLRVNPSSRLESRQRSSNFSTFELCAQKFSVKALVFIYFPEAFAHVEVTDWILLWTFLERLLNFRPKTEQLFSFPSRALLSPPGYLVIIYFDSVTPADAQFDTARTLDIKVKTEARAARAAEKLAKAEAAAELAAVDDDTSISSPPPSVSDEGGTVRDSEDAERRASGKSKSRTGAMGKNPKRRKQKRVVEPLIDEDSEDEDHDFERADHVHDARETREAEQAAEALRAAAAATILALKRGSVKIHGGSSWSDAGKDGSAVIKVVNDSESSAASTGPASQQSARVEGVDCSGPDGIAAAAAGNDTALPNALNPTLLLQSTRGAIVSSSSVLTGRVAGKEGGGGGGDERELKESEAWMHQDQQQRAVSAEKQRSGPKGKGMVRQCRHFEAAQSI